MEKKTSPFFKDLVKIFLVPALINKPFMLYFGSRYSAYPGEGYGYGLAFCVLVLVFSMGRFLWKYRHWND